jgi:hypothetical protein
MSNMVVGWPIHSDDGTFSGGSWETDLPLTNLQDELVANVARSTDAATASTVFDVDLGAAQPIFVLALVGHNLSDSATVQIRGDDATSFATATYDSGTVAAITTAEAALSWGDLTRIYVHCIGSAQTARYWRVNVYDTGNSDGYVEIGRAAVCQGWQPTINMDYGAQFGLESYTREILTDGGAAFYVERRNRRTVECAIQDLPEQEALDSWYHLQRRADRHGQFVFVYDADDSYHYERAFLATLREPRPIRAAVVSRFGVAMSAIEVI